MDGWMDGWMDGMRKGFQASLFCCFEKKIDLDFFASLVCAYLGII